MLLQRLERVHAKQNNSQLLLNCGVSICTDTDSVFLTATDGVADSMEECVITLWMLNFIWSTQVQRHTDADTQTDAKIINGDVLYICIDFSEG